MPKYGAKNDGTHLPCDKIESARIYLERRGYTVIPPDNDEIVRAGGLALDPFTRMVKWRGEAHHLTPREAQLLALYARRAPNVVTHQEAIRVVWGKQSSRNWENARIYVRYIRNKLGRDVLTTVLGNNISVGGYRLNCESGGVIV